MDHGYLNLPLGKRGDIDKQIDRYKKGQAKSAKAKAKTDAAINRDLVVQAKNRVEQLSDERLQELAKKFGKTVNQTKSYLLSQARWQPKLILNLRIANTD